MFFPSNFAPDAWLSFQALEPLLQESVLDLVEEAETDRSAARFSPEGLARSEAEVTVPSGRHLLFVEFLSTDGSERLLVSGVASVRLDRL